MRPSIAAAISAAVLALAGAAPCQELLREPTQEAVGEEACYRVDYLPTPPGELLEVGGLDFLADGRLVVSTRRGEVWLVTDALAPDPAAARFELFCEGLQEGLGLCVVDDVIHVLQRGELSTLHDDDGDGRADRVDCLSQAWGLSGNYHEFAFGLPRGPAGSFYVGLNLGFFSPEWWHGKSKEPWRGWILRIDPDGGAQPIACGLRSPCGLGLDAAGRLLVTDNQGDWMPACPIFHVREGAFFGHPASLDWTDEYRATATYASDTIPPDRPRASAAVWLPYEWSRSTGNLVPDLTRGRFGPFDEQLFVAELTNGHVLRAQLEEVQGELQGAVFPFRRRVGSSCRVRFAPDGTLLCGFTNRGWGGLAPAHGLARVRWTGVVPMEMRTVHLLQDGFEIGFTRPLAADAAPQPADVTLYDYDYDYWWEYGSPERDVRAIEVRSVEISADRRTLTVRTAGLEPARVARLALRRVVAEDGTPLLHEEFAYTINQLPEGPRTTAHVAKVVAPPPARERTEEGWLRLCWGDAFDAWTAEGWELCDAELDSADPRRIEIGPGVDALVNTGERPSHFVSRYELGDVALHLDFMLPEGGNSGVYLMGRYEVQLLDSGDRTDLGFGDLGGIYRGQTFPGRAPAVNAFKGPGEWHALDLEFRAPRFDAEGRKVANARFTDVRIDGVTVQDDVEIPEPTISAMFSDEAPTGPLMLQGDHGPVAYGGVRVRPLRTGREDAERWADLFPGLDVEGWTATDPEAWEVDGEVLTGSGPRSWLVSDRDDHADLELRAGVKISAGGRSAIVLRAREEDGDLVGYEARINASHPDEQRSGSLADLAPVLVQLVEADTWFDLAVTVRDEPEGTRVRIALNGVVVTDHLDRERRYGPGGLAILQYGETSVVELRDVRLRE